MIMGYLLVDPEVLESKGIQYFERIPDGRGIVDFSMLRVIGSVDNVQIVGTKRELDKLVREQKESGLYDTPTILPEVDGGQVTESGEMTDAQEQSPEPPAEENNEETDDVTTEEEGGANGE